MPIVFLPGEKVTYNEDFLRWEMENYGGKLPDSPIKRGREGTIIHFRHNIYRVLWTGTNKAVYVHADNLCRFPSK
jgi:hypothetical protein